jgi:hypothetical protein
VKTAQVSNPGFNTSTRYEYDVSGLAPGIYFIRATGRQLSSITKFEIIK